MNLSHSSDAADKSASRVCRGPWLSAVLLLLFWAGIYLPGLGSFEIKGEEARRILPARTMLSEGEWMSPQIGGAAYHRKPPLINWAVAGSFALSGVQNEWSARLPSVLAVLALGIVVWASARKWLGEDRALLAALFTLTSVGMIEKGRLIEIEALYIALFGIALALWLGNWMQQRSPWRLFAAPGFFLGLAMLAKGPLHLVYFYAIVIAILWQAGRWRLLGHPGHWLGILLTLAPFALWASQNPYTSEGASQSWAVQLTSRLSLATVDWGNWLLHPLEGLKHFLPWVILVVICWPRRPWLQKSTPLALAAKGLLGGAAISYLAIALIPHSQPRFTSLLLVPIALLAAWFADGLSEGQLRVWRRLNQALLVVLGIAIALGCLYFFERGGVVLFWLGLAYAIYFALRPSLRQWMERDELSPLLAHALTTSLAMVIGMIFYGVGMAPALARHDRIRPVGEKVAAWLQDSEYIAVLHPGYQPFLFYIEQPYFECTKVGDLPASVDALLTPRSVYEKKKHLSFFRDHPSEIQHTFMDQWGREQLLLVWKMPIKLDQK